MPGRTPEERLDRLEDNSIERGLTMQSLIDFNRQVVEPLVEQVKDLQNSSASAREEMASFKGALRMAMIVGSLLAFLIMAGLAYLGAQ